MARPADVTHVVLAGHLGGSETFNTGFWVAGAAPADDPTAQAYANLIVALPSFVALKDNLRSYIATDSGFDALRVYGYPTPGLGAQGVGSAAIPTGTGSGGNGNAMQICQVATLKSATASRSGRGRMFLPRDATTDIVNHLFTNTMTTGAANALTLFFDALNVAFPTRTVSVVSATHGTVHPVVNVTIDNKPDVQRRHANKQPATFVQVAVL